MLSSKNKWNIRWLGDHALVFSLPAMMDENIASSLQQLNYFFVSKQFIFIKDLIPAYHTLTIVYDIQLLHLFLAEKKCTLQSWAEHTLADFENNNSKINPNTTENIIKIPVCYDPVFGIDLENIKANNNISINEIVHKHSENIYTVYCLGFLPGFTYMGIVDEKIKHPRHLQPRAKVNAGSIGIAGSQTGIYPTTSPGGWQIIGRTPWQIFDKDPSKLAMLKAGDKVQFNPISIEEFYAINQHKI